MIARQYVSKVKWSIFPQKLQSELSAINEGFTARYDAVKTAFHKLEGILGEYKRKVKIDESFIL